VSIDPSSPLNDSADHDYYILTSPCTYTLHGWT